MSDMQKFDDNIIENLLMFSFKDDEQFYTNGAELVPLYRVVQILEHFKVQELVDKATPKKPEWGRTELGCGNCDSTRIIEIITGRKNKFCPDCGVEIDWNEE